jgi:hypothetical protein
MITGHSDGPQYQEHRFSHHEGSGLDIVNEKFRNLKN